MALTFSRHARGGLALLHWIMEGGHFSYLHSTAPCRPLTANMPTSQPAAPPHLLPQTRVLPWQSFRLHSLYNYTLFTSLYADLESPRLLGQHNCQETLEHKTTLHPTNASVCSPQDSLSWSYMITPGTTLLMQWENAHLILFSAEIIKTGLHHHHHLMH